MTNKDNIYKIYLALRTQLACAISHIVPPKEIEDIVQETYVRVCQVKRADSIKHPRAFLLRTARNLALDHIKKAESRLTVTMEDGEEFGYNETEGLKDQTFEQAATDEEFAHFCEAIRQLPMQCRRVFVLKKVYGYSQREIAEDLNVSESTVEKHIAVGIKRCTYFMMLRCDSGATGSLGKTSGKAWSSRQRGQS